MVQDCCTEGIKSLLRVRTRDEKKKFLGDYMTTNQLKVNRVSTFQSQNDVVTTEIKVGDYMSTLGDHKSAFDRRVE